jgi:hypothetical protein
MQFPDIHKFPKASIGPYERNMAGTITALLRLFKDRLPDPETNLRVLELSINMDHWSAGHAVFDCVRNRLVSAIDSKDLVLQAQYYFEESCLQAMYNATNPRDPFDPSSPFWIAGQAIGVARCVGVRIDDVVNIVSPCNP